MRGALGRLSLVVTLSAVACMSHNVDSYGSVDPTEHTVAVPPGSQGLKGDLKRSLVRLGWQLTVLEDGAVVTEGQSGATTNLKTYETYRTRYRLIVASSESVDFCWFAHQVEYEISFLDLKNGKEVFTIEGKGCQSDVVKKFEGAIEAK